MTLEQYLTKLAERREKYRLLREHASGGAVDFWNGKYTEAGRVIDDLKALSTTHGRTAEPGSLLR